MTTRCELLQPLGVLILDTDDDRRFGVGISEMCLDVSNIDRRRVGVEIAGPGYGSAQGSCAMLSF
jgi:hypothetical protein